MYEFKLPDLGEGIHEGEILKWFVKPGDTIREDDPLVEVETDKAAVTIPSPRSGKIVSVSGKEGDIVEVGQVLTVFEDGGGAAAPRAPEGNGGRAAVPARETPAASRGAAARTPAQPAARPAGVVTAPRAAAPTGGPVAAAPATRRLARELGVEIRHVPGSGPGGRVTPEDVRAFAEGGAPAGGGDGGAAALAAAYGADEDVAGGYTPGSTGIPFVEVEALPDFEQWGPVEKEPLRSIRRKVARKMVTSTVLVPHVGHMDEADVTELEAFRKRQRERLEGRPGGKLTLLAFVVKAVTECLKTHRMFNASLDPVRGEIVYKRFYNIGIAVDAGKGLIVPVIKNTDRMGVLEISAAIEHLAAKARAGQIEVADLQGGTFTITNVGPMGGMGMNATINYPEVGILGMGKATRKPVVLEDDELAIRTMLPVAISYDHRVADGADGGRFVADLVRRLSDPLTMLLDE